MTFSAAAPASSCCTASAGYATPRPALRLSLELWAAMNARQGADASKLLAMLSFSDEHLAELPDEYLPHVVQFATANIARGAAAQLDLALRMDVRPTWRRYRPRR